MEPRKRIAVIGYGNVGRHAVEAVNRTSDLELAGIVELSDSVLNNGKIPGPVVKDIKDLPEVQAALLCLPSRQIPAAAAELIAAGMYTVDCFDIHSEIVDYKNKLNALACKNETAAVLAAGWDPGTDSMIRCIFEFMTPAGITYTNFGPGMSMGHTVAARSVTGVKDALSVTMPLGAGLHKRLVYIVLKPGYEFSEVTARLKEDKYFSHDETAFIAVDDVESLIDMGHGVLIERKGVSGSAHNQWLNMQMSINNPALTAQIMIAAVRAAFRQKPGAYTMIEIPVIDYLPGDREDLIRRLV
ncbi:MAG: diaminopimelate dehydrogenase [Syntrophomonadaceae bacterium]|jgi:diaminopimelate dehydrogenase|nr:diaminopimelate dehydrogenase [Syntrophomonadaceae bacterium]